MILPSPRAALPAFSPALFVDLYELTMLQAYFDEGMRDRAVFSLFVRRLPARRHLLLACGLDTVLTCLETLHFDEPAIEYLASLQRFSPALLDHLRALRFTGDVYAVPEGTPVFANEPLVEIEAPIDEAQLVETIVMNQIHLQTLLASKAARVVHAAAGRRVVDFGLRRMHGFDAGLKAARAFHIAGVDATSNVAAGQAYGVPLAGTLAHSYIQAHDDERDALRRFVLAHPGTTWLVDTYNTIASVKHVIDLARELASQFRVSGIRLDSGDLVSLSKEARRLLDEAGLTNVTIFGSGNLNEDAIAALIQAGAPIGGFGVGTDMGVSSDAPSLDIVYKLVEYAGRGRVKRAAGKSVLPGRKQVFRLEQDGVIARDVIGQRDEALPGRPLLQCVMRGGVRTDAGRVTLDAARAHARRELAGLPAPLRSLAPLTAPYPVEISPTLRAAATASGAD